MSVMAKTTIALMKEFLNKGYHLQIDNWYTSVPLLEFLHSQETMCIGTARANRVPRELKNCKIAKGQLKSMTKGPHLAQKFEDKKTVYMLTTFHSAETVSKTTHGQECTIPKSIDAYNKNMEGVDRIDQMLEPYDTKQKTVRWYVKLAIYLIQIAVLNGWTLYRKRGGQGDFYAFSRNVIAFLVFRDGVLPTLENENLTRLTERHFIYEIPLTEGKLRPQKRKVCYKRGRRRDTHFYCPSCSSKSGLCLGECFEKYHTKKSFWL
ncbi:PiggyBac transposase uribo2 [Plakobranchus ocellatus]|uniref:PiggyBac transposase uribo2 n=1 Tax=Plakobranchus ocellatus TaxID=259542 RepID=A0AAV3Z5I8_9GAST|nr:PiggyBac transposase uribo2 [Plakobranchus ocellatus]